MLSKSTVLFFFIFQALNLILKFHPYMTLISKLGFPLVAEWTRSQSKAMVTTLITCAVSLGQMMLGGLAFVFREWRTLKLVVSAPFFVFSFSSRYEHLPHCVLRESGVKTLAELGYIDFLIP